MAIKNYILYTLLISMALASIGCKSTKSKNNAPEQSAINPEKELLISWMQGACYGTCPAYKISVYNNGSVEYTGILYVKKIGEHTGTLSTTQLTDLNEHLNNKDLNFFKLKDKYESENNVDFPSYTIIARKNGINKEVIDRGSDNPEELTDFQKYLKEFADALVLTEVK